MMKMMKIGPHNIKLSIVTNVDVCVDLHEVHIKVFVSVTLKKNKANLNLGLFDCSLQRTLLFVLFH